MDWIKSYWLPVVIGLLTLGGAWATLGQEIKQNTAHREQVQGLPEQVQGIAAAQYFHDCVADGTPKEVCRCEREELTKDEPKFRRCEHIENRLVRDGTAERVQTVVRDTIE